MSKPQVADLAHLLEEAKEEHIKWEGLLGPDPDWPKWYAGYILPRLNDLGRTHRLAIGITFKPGSWWIGAHWGKFNRRLCLNLLPMVTIWFALPGGKPGSGWRIL